MACVTYLVSEPLAGPQGSHGAPGDQIVEGPDDNVPFVGTTSIEGLRAAYLSSSRVESSRAGQIEQCWDAVSKVSHVSKY